MKIVWNTCALLGAGMLVYHCIGPSLIGPLAAQESTAPIYLSAEEYAATFPADVYAESRGRVPMIRREDLAPDRLPAYDQRADPDTTANPSEHDPDTTSLAGLYGPGGLRLHGSTEDRMGEDLGGRLKELIRLIVSREMDQPVEWTLHEPVALWEQLEPEIINVIRYAMPLTGIPEREAAMIQLGREVFQTHKVSSQTYARVLAAIGRKNLIDMCILMGDYTETAILLTVNDVRLPYDRPSLLPIP